MAGAYYEKIARVNLTTGEMLVVGVVVVVGVMFLGGGGVGGGVGRSRHC